MIAGSLLVASPAPANIQEQRARLPPPARCTDPVLGVWMSHAYYAFAGQWYISQLTIRRAPGSTTELTGEMFAHYWNGGPRDEQPPACAPGVYRKSVDQPARGRINGNRIEFWATSWRAAAVYCNTPATAYNLDRYSGTIDPALQEFQSLINDGGRFINVPVVFRRIRCLDAAGSKRPRVEVAPPPLAPPGRTGGCGGC